MRLRKPLAAIAAAAITAAVGLVAAPAAHAAPPEVVVNYDGSNTPTITGNTAVSGTQVLVKNDGASSASIFVVEANGFLSTAIGGVLCQAATNVCGPLAPGGSLLLSIAANTPDNTAVGLYSENGGVPNTSITNNAFTITYSSGGGGGGGGSTGSSTAASPAPADVHLALGADANSVGGAVCAEGTSLVGVTGQWMTLPGQGDCTLPSTPGAKLLGWSTSASFPVAIAQRQADHGWGTYEIAAEDGTILAVFIPAGWGTFVAGSSTLFPIWSS